MKLIVEKNYDGISKRAAEIILEEIKRNREAILGLATGSTPIGTYRELIKAYDEKKVDFSKIVSFNLDEYIGLSPEDTNSYRYFMDDNLFKHINIKKENTYVPDGMAKDLGEYCKAYDRLIEEKGGIDIQILGIGSNGHIAFNEPNESLALGTNVVDLKESTIKDNARFFDSIEAVPKKAITMGIGSIFKAKKIILLASGESKREIMNQLLNNSEITTKLPASILLLHRDVTVIVDEKAYGK